MANVASVRGSLKLRTLMPSAQYAGQLTTGQMSMKHLEKARLSLVASPDVDHTISFTRVMVYLHQQLADRENVINVLWEVEGLRTSVEEFGKKAEALRELNDNQQQEVTKQQKVEEEPHDMPGKAEAILSIKNYMEAETKPSCQVLKWSRPSGGSALGSKCNVGWEAHNGFAKRSFQMQVLSGSTKLYIILSCLEELSSLRLNQVRELSGAVIGAIATKPTVYNIARDKKVSRDSGSATLRKSYESPDVILVKLLAVALRRSTDNAVSIRKISQR
ncbi:hypothetical protein BSKO_02623 [Bryopsis sp. KO-2023]|nr:hypothetical protein BSKO_02623 [Bryopsis sp. KO-2023]